MLKALALYCFSKVILEHTTLFVVRGTNDNIAKVNIMLLA